MRRGVPALLVPVGLALLLGWYVYYTRSVIRELRQEARSAARMYAQVYRALGAPGDEERLTALLDLSKHIGASGVPVVVVGADGRPSAAVNLPFASGPAEITDPKVAQRVVAYARELDRKNEPVVEPGSTVHYGDAPLVDELRTIPVLQATTLLLLIAAGAFLLRTRSRADREKVWAGMARESAHQLATPISSIG